MLLQTWLSQWRLKSDALNQKPLFFFFFGLCTDSSADALIAAMHKNPGPAQGL